MKTFTVKEINNILGGRVLQGNTDFQIKDVVFPWRLKEIKNAQTLIFLKQSRINPDAIPKDIPLVVVIDKACEELTSYSELIVIKVNNVKKAYWRFVQYYRSLFHIPIIAVTGTCGKSTTKEMIKHILSLNRNIQATHRSENSRRLHLRYLLNLDDSTDAAVFETAVGEPNDIKNACRYFKPTIGIITNIGEEHLDHCKTIETYVQAKAEMLNGLDKDGILILNSDDEKTRTIELDNYKGKVVYFGVLHTADYYATDICYGNGGMTFVLEYHKMKYPIYVPGYGEHQVYNALAAIAAVHVLGIGIAEAGERLRLYKNLSRHTEIAQGYAGSTIIDDTWSLNTTSLRAGLKVLNRIGQGKTRVLLITDIETLGQMSCKIHKLAEEIIINEGLDILVTIGKMTQQMTENLKRRGMNATLYSFPDYKDASELLEKILNKDCVLLIKGPMFDQSMMQLAAKLKSI